MAFVTCFTVLLVTMATCVHSNDYPWINDNDVKVINRTDTSVVLAWHLPKEVDLQNVQDYRLVVRYRRQGYSPRIIEAHLADPDCSLILSHCHLRDLVPGQAYSVTIIIDHVHNRSILGKADLPFATLDVPDKENEMEWWLLYAGVPAAILIILLVTVLCIARCCRCWCWNKKKKSNKITPKPAKEKEQKKESGTTSSDSSSLDRKHSLQTRLWVKDTLATIDLDPESSTYDQPLASMHYDIPQGLNPTHPTPPASSIMGRNHYYLEIVDDVPGPASSSATRDRSKSASTTPEIKTKGKKLKKAKTNPNLLTSSAGLSPPANDQESFLPPKPCKIKPPKDLLLKSASLPPSRPEAKVHTTPRRETPPTSPLSELQQKLQGKLQQQQLLEEQTALETHHYANTDDLNKLKGNARKMFPML